MGLILGDEHEGIDPGWLGMCRQAVTIPMRPGASSLNVAVAAGILIHHWTRDRLSPGAEVQPRRPGPCGQLPRA
jgi:tRNA G18 (ribose-2'-O)-methylase SpoU